MKKFNRKNLNKGLSILFCLGIIGSLTSCHESEPESPYVDPPKKSTILIYAVASNSLSQNLVSDKNEMLMGAENINLEENNILVFETQYKYLPDNTRIDNVNLLKLEKEGETYVWNVEKEYNDGVASLNSTRISEIVNMMTEQYPADSYGMIFWSHSTGSQPYFVTETDVRCGTETVNLPMQYSFGQDIPVGNGYPYYQINVEDLASAIPDNLLEFIWFDSCYMSNIESIYQFRNKCKTFVGYATEVLDAGLPYQYVLPAMVGDAPDLIGAAQIFFRYYSSSIATIAVTDMTKIENLAEYCASIYQPVSQSVSGMIKYTRNTTGPFYDLGDYTKALAAQSDIEVTDEAWEEVLSSCILFKAATSYDFSGNRIPSERYSGISTHIYDFSEGANDSEKEVYYKSLDWYKRVFPNN